MATPKQVYQAVVGITFEGLKPPVRVESGSAIPEKASAADIEWLLDQGLIKPVMPKQPESEESDG